MTVLGLIAGSMLIAATLQRGPGMGAYLPWASALVQGTPAPLHSPTLSPTGFPLRHHYLGTGLFLALPTLLSGGGVNVERSARFAASAAILLTLACCASLLYQIAKKRVGLLLFGLSLLLVATNTGYYLRLIGSELFALALVAAVVWLAWVPKEIGNSELAGLSALASLLMIVRPQAIIMASPAIVLGLLRWAGERSKPQLAWAFLYFGAPLTLGCFVMLQFNHWMTGDWTRSPLYFGNDEFRSIDLSARYIYLVLFDPRSGALCYTPFIALGLCASLVPILDRRLDKPYRVFYIVALLAELAQCWMISGFYAWSGGVQGFGSRYLNLLSLYGVISVVYLLASERVIWALKAVILSISLACVVYTAALLLLGRPYLLGSLAIGATAAAWMAGAKTRPRDSVLDITYGCLGLSLLFPLLYYYASLARAQVATVLTATAMMSACVAAVVIVIGVYWIWSAIPRSFPTKSLAILSVCTLITGFSLVVRLRVGAAPFQARELASPSPQFLYRNRFEVRNLERDLVGLGSEEAYKWPDEVRHAIRVFLEDEKQRTAISRP